MTEVMSETSTPEGKVVLQDGVGILRRGDAVLIVYQKDARLARTRWLFDVIDGILAHSESDLLGLLIVLPNSGPPDTATLQENAVRLRRISDRIRRAVTVPLGTDFKISIVRAVMRGLNVVLGHSGTRFVADTIELGVTQLLEAKSPRTPSRAQLFADICELFAALGASDPRHDSAR
jgi:hypothetical protein